MLIAIFSLTVLGVVIGVMAVITMVTVGNGASQAIRTQIESFGKAAGAQENAGLAMGATLPMQCQQGIAGGFPLHQQRIPLGTQPFGHLLHLQIGRAHV